MQFAQVILLSVCCAAGVCCAGCGGSAVSSGANSSLDSKDLTTMTDQMARSMTTDPRIAQQIGQSGPLKIVCLPVENQMTGEIIPAGQAQAYTARIRSLLSEKSPEQFTWIMNRDEFIQLRGSELDAKLGPSPDAIQPQYALHAVFQSLTKEDSGHRSSYYLCVYRLTDLQDRVQLWTGRYEIKKNQVKGFLD